MVAANAAPHQSTWPYAWKGSTGMHARFAALPPTSSAT
jgi:hypothetical protein